MQQQSTHSYTHLCALTWCGCSQLRLRDYPPKKGRRPARLKTGLSARFGSARLGSECSRRLGTIQPCSGNKTHQSFTIARLSHTGLFWAPRRVFVILTEWEIHTWRQQCTVSRVVLCVIVIIVACWVCRRRCDYQNQTYGGSDGEFCVLQVASSMQKAEEGSLQHVVNVVRRRLPLILTLTSTTEYFVTFYYNT